MPIKSDELCAKCFYDADNPGCNGVACTECAMNKLRPGVINRYYCVCTEIRDGDPCPHFKPYQEEHTEEPDYDELLRTLF